MEYSLFSPTPSKRKDIVHLTDEKLYSLLVALAVPLPLLPDLPDTLILRLELELMLADPPALLLDLGPLLPPLPDPLFPDLPDTLILALELMLADPPALLLDLGPLLPPLPDPLLPPLPDPLLPPLPDLPDTLKLELELMLEL